MTKETEKSAAAASGTGAGMKIATIVAVLLLVAGVVYLRHRDDAGLRTELRPIEELLETPSAPSVPIEGTGATAEVAAAQPAVAPQPATTSNSATRSATSPASTPSTPAGTTKPAAETPPTAPTAEPTAEVAPSPTPKARPRLLDLGAKSCVPCRMMAPILEDLRVNYSDRFQTIFIDVWERPEAGQQYRIRMIPTQIFYDGDGRELGRHEGFMSKEDILGTWRRLGYDFGS